MRDCLVIGSGRSGTSMVAGMLAAAGYHTGDDHLPARHANPWGFFEDSHVVAVNERILEAHVPLARGPLPVWRRRRSLRPGQRWLAELPLDIALSAPPAMSERLAPLLRARPFAYKDPRFCYTLPLWRPHLGATAFVCVFREPERTADSIARECVEQNYGIVMDCRRAMRVWTACYRHVVESHRHHGDWLFIHYDQVISGDGVESLGAFLDATLDPGFARPAAARSRRDRPVADEEARMLYRQLCDLARFEPDG